MKTTTEIIKAMETSNKELIELREKFNKSGINKKSVYTDSFEYTTNSVIDNARLKFIYSMNPSVPSYFNFKPANRNESISFLYSYIDMNSIEYAVNSKCGAGFFDSDFNMIIGSDNLLGLNGQVGFKRLNNGWIVSDKAQRNNIQYDEVFVPTCPSFKGLKYITFNNCQDIVCINEFGSLYCNSLLAFAEYKVYKKNMANTNVDMFITYTHQSGFDPMMFDVKIINKAEFKVFNESEIFKNAIVQNIGYEMTVLRDELSANEMKANTKDADSPVIDEEYCQKHLKFLEEILNKRYRLKKDE